MDIVGTIKYHLFHPTTAEKDIIYVFTLIFGALVFHLIVVPVVSKYCCNKAKRD